ncbi:MAG: type III-B CRISPR-associated protein Cas10/Cmr2 [Bacteroidia bacterium]|nr:type III-B CRISPR-associated protein Cas10/Cmr2 [Bacteroidia bacterium]
MTHLFLFTIGPVQGFIAQARKTRDLAAGNI